MQALPYSHCSQALPAFQLSTAQGHQTLTSAILRFFAKFAMQWRYYGLLAVLSFCLAPTFAATISTEDLNALTQEIAQEHNLDPAWVANQLQQAQIEDRSIDLFRPAPGVRFKNWNNYKTRFVTPERVAAGVAFWQRNREALMQAQQKFGVPAEIIVAILGVETNYGQNMGSFRALDTLTTLALHFPKTHPRAEQRMQFFRQELGQLLALAHQNQQNPLFYKGSYAGALGISQFMPSSWDQYAIDFNDDARINLFESEADAIGSVANYLAQHGWQKELPTHYPIQITSNAADLKYLLEPDIVPSFTQETLRQRGVTLQAQDTQTQATLALIELLNDPEDKADYVAGTKNFYVITRYNQSSYYAMAVIELAQAIQAQIFK